MKFPIFVKICASILYFYLSTIDVNSQYSSGLAPHSDPTKSVISPPPTASGLGKYAEIPVGLYTGIPSISIPLYQIVENDYHLDISLSYHASGIKVQDRASWVGLGWSLNAGGIITRAVRGLADDADTILASYYDENTGLHRQFICGPAGKLTTEFTCDYHSRDSESDEYFYNFNGHVGSFVFDANNQPRISDGSNIKIDPITIDSRGIVSFILTTDDGLKYTFSDRELTCSLPMIPDIIDFPYYSMVDGPTPGNGIKLSWFTHVSSWYLSKIEFPDSNKKIQFTYTSYKYSYLERTGEMKYIGIAPWQDFCRELHSVRMNTYYPYSNFLIDGLYLSQITWSGGKLSFIPSTTERTDIYVSNRTDFGYYATKEKYLSQIQICDKNNNEIKRYNLGYSYFNATGCNNSHYAYGYDGDQLDISHLYYRLKLDAVTEVSGSLSKPAYIFHYKEDGYLPFRYSPEADFWGYYNANGATSLIPDTYFYECLTSSFDTLRNSLFQSIYVPIELTGLGNPTRKLSGSHREAANSNVSQAYILKKIIYPTGGSDSFIYEPNRFKIVNPCFTNDSIEMYGGGIRIRQIDTYDPVTKITKTKSFSYVNPDSTSTGRIMNFPLFARQKSTYEPVYDSLHIIRFSSSLTDLGTTQGSYVGYSKVTVSYNGNGKEINTFDLPATFGVINDGMDSTSNSYIYNRSQADPYKPFATSGFGGFYDFSPFPPDPDYNWNRGQLLTQETYDNDNHKLKKIVNTYKIGSYFKDTLRQHYFITYPYCGDNGAGSSSGEFFNNYCLLTGWKYLAKHEVYTYDPSDESKYTKETTTYSYNNSTYKQLSSVTKTKSDQSTQTINYSYCFDFTNKPDTIQQLFNKYITSFPIEAVSYTGSGVNTRYLGGIINRYNPSGKLIQILEIETQNPYTSHSYAREHSTASTFICDPKYRKETTYEYYTSGNLASIQKTGGIKTSYYWGYYDNYPVVEAINMNAATLNTKLHDVYFTLGYTSLDDLLNSITTFPNSMWTTFNTNLRNNNPNTFFTTYTFKPLIGQTSQINPANKITFFSQDNFGRLLNIKDLDNNIIQEYNYHFME